MCVCVRIHMRVDENVVDKIKSSKSQLLSYLTCSMQWREDLATDTTPDTATDTATHIATHTCNPPRRHQLFFEFAIHI